MQYRAQNIKKFPVFREKLFYDEASNEIKTGYVLEKDNLINIISCFVTLELCFRDVTFLNTKQKPIQSVSEFLETKLLLSLNRLCLH